MTGEPRGGRDSIGDRIDVVLATTRPLPEPDPCEAPLLAALRAQDLSAASWAWRDPDVDWSRARAVVLRATWDYPWHADRFVAWLGRVAGETRLHNPLPAALWNVHKRYLLDLARAGVATVPTLVAARGDTRALADLCRTAGWPRAVIKPAVGAGSFETWPVSWDGADLPEITGLEPAQPASARPETVARRFARLVADRDMLVQPLVPSVLRSGERSLVFVDGALSHVMHKAPRFAGDDERVSGPHPVRPADLDLARAALALSPTPLLYARVDLVDRQDGAPMVSELELLEPSLFLAAHPPAAHRLAAALARELSADEPRQ